MQNFGVINKEYYGMLRYFLQWSINRKKNITLALEDSINQHPNKANFVTQGGEAKEVSQQAGKSFCTGKNWF